MISQPSQFPQDLKFVRRRSLPSVRRISLMASVVAVPFANG